MNIKVHRSFGTIPDGWTDCPEKSSLIGDKFIICKTFLGGYFDGQICKEKRFNWKILKESVEAEYKRKVGMVLDLTNTSRFYDKAVVERDGCKYVKIACKGFGECPSPKDVEEFIGIVQRFDVESPRKVICVHCTHGFNRSGFMVVSYLCGMTKLNLQASVELFANGRSPGIYKTDYLAELSKRYGGAQLETPERPYWHGENGKKARARFNNMKKTKFMDGLVENVDNVTNVDLVNEIQSIVGNICGWRGCRFPGSQPVSMDVENVEKLTLNNYRVTWKADGQRYLMLIKGKSEIYMLDRDFAVYRANNLTFPRRKALDEHLTDTLLDGEMVIDKYPECSRGRYLVYDIIRFEGQEVCKTVLDTRLYCIAREIVEPRTLKFQKGLLNKIAEPFSINAKDYWDLTKTRAILDGDFSRQLLHCSDGLVFQPVDEVYQFGQCKAILKWKSPELNSVDFKLRIERANGCRPVANLMVGASREAFSSIELTEELAQYENKIIECSWDYGRRAWTFMRERTDKSFPNHVETARAIVKSIENPVTKDYLYRVIDGLNKPVEAEANRKEKLRRQGEDKPVPLSIHKRPRVSLGLLEEEQEECEVKKRKKMTRIE